MDTQHSPGDFFDDLMVVLVIYKMQISESPAFVTLSRSLQLTGRSTSIFIYDNSPLSQPIPQSKSWTIYYYHDEANSGVSRAYNEGFKKVITTNKKWLLISDQDTRFPERFFEAMTTARSAHSGNEFFVPIVKNEHVLISPFRFRLGRGFVLNKIDRDHYSLDKYRFINSGLLISSSLFEKCGGYDERFPLDFSDLAFAHHIKRHQNQFRVIQAICRHHLSSEEKKFSKTLDRFSYFVRASRLYGATFDSPLILSINRFFRAVKLGLQFKSFEFVRCLYRTTNSNYD